MNDFNLLFRQRLSLSMEQRYTFDDLPYILDRTSKALPFENLRVILNYKKTINRKNLTDKILKQREGGLCYELNPLLHLFLLENGFDTSMYYGRVFDGTEFGSKTHVMFLVKHAGKDYLIDTGFGGNLPLKPVPMTGETIHSRSGSFRIIKKEDAHILEMNLATSQKGWEPGYKFYINDPVRHIEELDTVQDAIFNNEDSPFNKEPLITAFINEGRHILTKTNYTVWTGTYSEKMEIESEQFHKYAKRYFGLNFEL